MKTFPLSCRYRTLRRCLAFPVCRFCNGSHCPHGGDYVKFRSLCSQHIYSTQILYSLKFYVTAIDANRTEAIKIIIKTGKTRLRACVTGNRLLVIERAKKSIAKRTLQRCSTIIFSIYCSFEFIDTGRPRATYTNQADKTHFKS